MLVRTRKHDTGPAAAALLTAPVLIATILAQRQIVTGLTAGGLKDG
jgi:multiple sugar transport system permease protein